MISYPLREYISSKKDDDYRQDIGPARSPPAKDKDTQPPKSHRSVCLIVSLLVTLILSAFYSFYSYVDPTCFNRECTEFVCKAFAEGLVGGRLCPELCTTKSLQLQNCLGQHKQFRSRLFDDDDGNQVIRCYLKHPLSKLNPSADVQGHFDFPRDESTLDAFYVALEQHIRKTIELDNTEPFIEDLIKFADFNKDERISLSEARSLWSLVQVDEFIYTMLLSDKVYTPKIHATCGHLFAVEKVLVQHLPFDEEQELYPSSERPNWYQRLKLAIGITEFFSDTWHFRDSNQHLQLCQPLVRSFGYDKDFETKVLKLNHMVSSSSMLSRLPHRCDENRDCLYDSYCYGWCNTSTNVCQMNVFNENSLNELCSLVSSLVLPDANSTFVGSFKQLIEQCQQIVNDETVFRGSSTELTSLQIRETLFLQNLKNLFWMHIEYQMNKITRKSTKRPAAGPVHSKK